MREGAVSALPSKGPSGRLHPHQTFTWVHPRQRAPLVGGTHHEKDSRPYMPVPLWGLVVRMAPHLSTSKMGLLEPTPLTTEGRYEGKQTHLHKTALEALHLKH